MITWHPPEPQSRPHDARYPVVGAIITTIASLILWAAIISFAVAAMHFLRGLFA